MSFTRNPTIDTRQTWNGGDALVTISPSDYFVRGAVVTLNTRELRGDGRPGGQWQALRTFDEPGEHRFNLPPCNYAFEARLPDRESVHVDARLESAPARRNARPPTELERLHTLIAELTGRVAALEKALALTAK